MLITVASFPWRLTHNEHNILGVSPAFVLITNVTKLAVIFLGEISSLPGDYCKAEKQSG